MIDQTQYLRGPMWFVTKGRNTPFRPGEVPLRGYDPKWATRDYGKVGQSHSIRVNRVRNTPGSVTQCKRYRMDFGMSFGFKL